MSIENVETSQGAGRLSSLGDPKSQLWTLREMLISRVLVASVCSSVQDQVLARVATPLWDRAWFQIGIQVRDQLWENMTGKGVPTLRMPR